MKNKENLKYIIIIVILIIVAILIALIPHMFDDDNSSSELSEEDVDVSIEYEDEDEDINWEDEDYTDIQLEDSINITSAGTYHLTGSIDDGNITINVGDNDLVILVLDNVDITCSDSPAIYVENARKVIIIVEEGTTNTLTDGSTYSTTDDEPNGAIFSKDDLVINGTGTLNVNANYLDGIVSKDGLKIIGTTINVTANDDGIRGKDYIGIKDANITVISNSDGIKSTNDSDTEKGFILIENSILNIEAGEDGIQAETTVKIIDGEFNIETGGGSQNSSTEDDWGNWGLRDNNMMNPINNTDTSDEDEVSAKGIKGNTGILIENGTFNIDSSDDSLHSNGIIIIKNGTFEIASGDDGIHADESIIIDDGYINISKSYEGIEASKIEINGGTIYIVASDDGINVAGGNDSSSISGRPGQNSFSSNTNQTLTINGGYIEIDASGDGIDINGSGYINGGKVLVSGPTSSGDSALDYDGTLEITGGELIAAGPTGMMQTPSNSSTVYSIVYIYSDTQDANTEITIMNSDNEEIASFTPSKSYNSVIISSEELENGETYTIYSNGEEIGEITIDNIVTTVGNSNSGMQNIGNGGG